MFIIIIIIIIFKIWNFFFSNDTGESGSGGNSSDNKGYYNPFPLTEEVLCKHNMDQQKIFLESHRKRVKTKLSDDKPKKKTSKRVSHWSLLFRIQYKIKFCWCLF